MAAPKEHFRKTVKPYLFYGNAPTLGGYAFGYDTGSIFGIFGHESIRKILLRSVQRPTRRNHSLHPGWCFLTESACLSPIYSGVAEPSYVEVLCSRLTLRSVALRTMLNVSSLVGSSMAWQMAVSNQDYQTGNNF